MSCGPYRRFVPDSHARPAVFLKPCKHATIFMRACVVVPKVSSSFCVMMWLHCHSSDLLTDPTVSNVNLQHVHRRPGWSKIRTLPPPLALVHTDANHANDFEPVMADPKAERTPRSAQLILYSVYTSDCGYLSGRTACRSIHTLELPHFIALQVKGS